MPLVTVRFNVGFGEVDLPAIRADWCDFIRHARELVIACRESDFEVLVDELRMNKDTCPPAIDHAEKLAEALREMLAVNRGRMRGTEVSGTEEAIDALAAYDAAKGGK